MFKTLKTNKYFSYFTSFFSRGPNNSPLEFPSDQLVLSNNMKKIDNILSLNFPSIESGKIGGSTIRENSEVTENKLNYNKELSLPSKSFSDLISQNPIIEKKNKNKKKYKFGYNKSKVIDLFGINYSEVKEEKKFQDIHNNHKSDNYIFNIFSSSIYVQLFNNVKNYIFSSTPQIMNQPLYELPNASDKSQNSYGLVEKVELIPNVLKNRVSVVQYAANSPIEDRYNAIQLKNLKGYCLQVLDGHGGSQVAEFANKKLYTQFDSKYLELILNNNEMSEEEKIKESIIHAFTVVVSFSINY